MIGDVRILLSDAGDDGQPAAKALWVYEVCVWMTCVTWQCLAIKTLHVHIMAKSHTSNESGQVIHTLASITELYNLVSAKEQWRSVVEKVMSACCHVLLPSPVDWLPGDWLSSGTIQVLVSSTSLPLSYEWHLMPSTRMLQSQLVYTLH